MDSLNQFAQGMQNVLAPEMLIYALIGCLVGMVVGILPGFGPAAATALLFPLTFSLGATESLVMMAAVLYGATYGGSITAVLLKVPGEASSVATTIDGHAMAKAGRAGPALVIAAVGGFIACVVATFGFVAATPLTRFAVTLGPVEMFALTILALLIAAGLVGRSVTKGMVAVAFGLLLATVGRDPLSGMERFTGGANGLIDGLDIIPVIMGLFGLTELFSTVERRHREQQAIKVGRIMPSRQDFKDSAGPVARGTIIGFFLGLVPGSPGATTAFASYTLEKKLSKHPEQFGKGAIQGVAGPESANNALSVAGMIPLFTLGIPSSATMAIMFGVFTSNGLIPGPTLFTETPEVPWTILASIVVGNVILLILNVPLVRIWVLVLKTPYPVLYAIVVVFLVIGAYSLRNSTFDIIVLIGSGLFGYLLEKIDVPASPIALTLVLGDLMETSFRQTLALSQGSMSGFVSSTTAIVIYAITAIALASIPIGRNLKARRDRRVSDTPDRRMTPV
ncbi:tripartite tricarboxylate transporter permease [Nocardioides cavernae]|uniref:Tripartite tricarboxylate transporter permease n=1 Tax=Nocardioides cavernae TaxID=1921566 RepID=A0ABR8N7Y0_9ACTN|nr:tripartite tricarboxylate transporter permease [Nocardioides cavernae]MBD3924237.1 tripartite tricarboxylate transporter permease [Nocardioides cavernae]MBM7510824.1 putative tricarboxylic transport membrane protein [Nocardioides cavernae]